MKESIKSQYCVWHEDCIWEETDFGLIAIKLSKGTEKPLSIRLNREGRDTWRLLDGSMKVEEILARLSTIYKSEKGVIERDVLKFLAYLEEKGLIEFRESPHPRQNMILNPESEIRANETVNYKMNGQKLTIFSNKTKRLFTFDNPFLLDLWKLCTRGSTLKDLIKKIGERLEEGVDIKSRVKLMIRLLAKNDLLLVSTKDDVKTDKEGYNA